MTGAIARSRLDSQVSNLSPIANSFSLSKPLLFSASLVACLASQAFAQPTDDEKNLSDHWLIPWGTSLQRLRGDAGDAPIVQDRTNWYVNAGIAYRF